MSQMIVERSYEIEKNMNMNISPRKNIDLSIIEELKKKRALQTGRMTGY